MTDYNLFIRPRGFFDSETSDQPVRMRFEYGDIPVLKIDFFPGVLHAGDTLVFAGDNDMVFYNSAAENILKSDTCMLLNKHLVIQSEVESRHIEIPVNTRTVKFRDVVNGRKRDVEINIAMYCRHEGKKEVLYYQLAKGTGLCAGIIADYDAVPEPITTDEYYTKKQLNALLAVKADSTALTAHADDTDIHVTLEDKDGWSGKAEKQDITKAINGLSAVAKTGSYNDLSNKPALVTQTDIDDAVKAHNIAQDAHSELFSSKQDKITPDAPLSAESVSGLSTVATTGSYNDLSDQPVIPVIPDKVSEFTNDADYQNKTQMDTAIADATAPLATTKSVTAGLAGKQDKIDDTHKLPAVNVDGLSAVATTGSYNDLSDHPVIPAAANDARITLTQGGVEKGSFTLNQQGDAVIEVDAGGGGVPGGGGITPSETFPASPKEKDCILYAGESTAMHTHGHIYQFVNGEWVDAQTGVLPIGNCSNITCIKQGLNVKIRFQDPNDTYAGDVKIAMWGKTVLVRKKDSYPTAIADGTVVVSNNIRNQYFAQAVVDSLPEEGNWFYKLFPMTVEGRITVDDSNQFEAGDLTFNAISDIVRRGETDEYFHIGDAITVTIAGETEADEPMEIDYQIVAKNKEKVSKLVFTRNNSLDFDKGKAWSGDSTFNDNSHLWNGHGAVYTTSEEPLESDSVYADAMCTIACGTVAMTGINEIFVELTSNISFLPVTPVTKTNYEFDASEDTYALTADVNFNPVKLLNVTPKGSGNAIVFGQYSPGTWYQLNGSKVLFMNGDSFELWNCSSSDHSLTSQIDKTTGLASDVMTATWESGTAIAYAPCYFTKSETGEYVASEVEPDGVVTPNTYYEKCHNDRKYGYNLDAESGMRKYLNGFGKDWWSPSSIWDKAPSYASKTGYLSRLPKEFYEILVPVDVTVTRNTVDAMGGYDVLSDKAWLVSQKQVNGSAVNGINEGDTYDYYTGAGNPERIKYNKAGQAVEWRLRSPNPNSSYRVTYVLSSGAFIDYSANARLAVVPACAVA